MTMTEYLQAVRTQTQAEVNEQIRQHDAHNVDFMAEAQATQSVHYIDDSTYGLYGSQL